MIPLRDDNSPATKPVVTIALRKKQAPRRRGFHVVTQKRSATWDDAPRPPAAVRIAGLTSIVLWVSVILAGRMTSYTMFSYR